MKAVPLAFQGVLLGLLSTSLHAQTLLTPGSATWSTVTTSTGEKTIFTISENTVLDWAQLNLGEGSELVFDFVGGDSVINNLTGTGKHTIDGIVTGNGLVAFFSPNARLDVGGSITAEGVTIATLNVDPVDFSDGGAYTLSNPGAPQRLTISGSIHATVSDVTIAGPNLNITSKAEISAENGSVYFGAGNEVTVSDNGTRRLNVVGTIGSLNHNGETNAARMEVAAGSEIRNNGTLNVGSSKIFLEVNADSGSISNEFNGIIVGDASFDGALLDDGLIIIPRTDDTPPAVSEGRLKIPQLKRPDGSKITTRETVSYSAPMSASSDAGRAAKTKDRQVAKVDSSKSLLKRSNFFGMRGGKTVASR